MQSFRYVPRRLPPAISSRLYLVSICTRSSLSISRLFSTVPPDFLIDLSYVRTMQRVPDSNVESFLDRSRAFERGNVAISSIETVCENMLRIQRRNNTRSSLLFVSRYLTMYCVCLLTRETLVTRDLRFCLHMSFACVFTSVQCVRYDKCADVRYQFP